MLNTVVVGVTVILGILWTPVMADAQPPARVARVGVLFGALQTPEATRIRLETLKKGLAEHGYVEGQNLAIESKVPAIPRSILVHADRVIE